jgi:5-methyltetrahydropteroyltriglutamate--homocysteine methyltransferase
MTQQAQNDFYEDEAELALAYAVAVNEEARDLKSAGADVVQIDEPYLQARPEQARAYGVKAIDRALDGIEGDTALHICFGYGHIVKDKPAGYSFLEELNDCAARQISVETAQPRLDLSVLRGLPDKTILLGVLDLSDTAPVETREAVAARIREAVAHIPAERLVIAPDCGMKYLPREVAFAKLEAMVAGTELVRRELTG